MKSRLLAISFLAGLAAYGQQSGPTILSTSPLPAALQNSFYSFTFTGTPTSNVQTFWSVPSGSLPPGLVFSNTGVLTGTPLTTGSFSFPVTFSVLNNLILSSTTSTFALTVNPNLPIITSSSPLPSATQNIPYSFTFTSNFTPNPTTQAAWGVPSGSLPPGLGFSSGGVLSGTPAATGSFSFPVTLTIFIPASTAPPIIVATTTSTFALAVNPPVAITSTSPLPPGDVGTPYSFTFTSSGGSAPITWSTFSATGLGGLALNPATGVLSGTPTTAGTASFFVTASDRNQSSSFRQFSVVLNPQLTITTNSLPNAIQGVPYSANLASTGGTPPFSWLLISGAPPGIALNAAGVFSGAPLIAGAFRVIVQVTDAAGAVVQAGLPLTVIPRLAISTASPLPAGEVGLPYSVPLVANGGLAPLTWAVTAGSLPTGLALSANGTLAGTPGASGTFTFTAQVADSGQGPLQQTAQGIFSVTIAPRLAITSGPNLPTATPGSPYSFLFTASGGVPPLNWSVASGALPAGVTLNAATGALSGAPPVSGVSTFIIQVTDALQASSTQPVTISVLSNPTLVITTGTALPSGVAGVPYTLTLSASGGTQPITWSMVSGSPLPPGLGLTQGGILNGTPTAPGTYSFSLQASDSSPVPQTARQTFQLTINGALSITSASPLPGGIQGAAYALTFSSSGGTGPVTWSVVPGTSLAPGLTLNALGVLGGAPSSTGTFNFTIQAMDITGATATKTFAITVTAPLTITILPPLPAGTVGSTYSFTFAASGGVAPLTWSIASGSLPAGLTLNPSTGALSGTPSAAGTATFTIQATDSARSIASQAFSITVNSGLAITTASPLPSGTMGTAYSLTFAASGAAAPLTWALAPGTAPPPGLALDAAGNLTGTPSQNGSFNFTVTLTDGARQTASKPFALTINAIPLSITTTSPLLIGAAGTPYSVILSASGGTQPFVWSLAEGVPPAGLSLADNGVLSGTPRAVGTFSFSVAVSDAGGNMQVRQFQLALSAPQAPPFSIGGIRDTETPNNQPQLQLTLGAPYPLDIAGQLTLTFDSAVGGSDQMVRFANGLRQVGFTVPAGATTAVFSPAQMGTVITGTVAGTITLNVTQFQAGGVDIAPVPAPRRIQIAPAAPVITSLTVVRTAAGFDVQIVGFSTPRQVLQGRFQFAGTNLGTSQLDVNLDPIFAPYYQSAASAQFGSQFTLLQSFSVQGDPRAVQSVSVVLTNGQGGSQAATATLP